LVLLLCAGSASATPYTIDSPVDLSVGALDVRFLPVTSIDPGTLGIYPAVDPLDSTSQDWFVVKVSVLATSTLDLVGVGIGNPVSLAEGASVLLGGGVTPTAVDATNPAPGTNDIPLFSFTGFGSGTSDVLVVAYAAGDLPGAGIPPFLPPGTVNLNVDNGATVESTSGTVVGGVTIVPEPGTAVLLSVGLICISSPRRRRTLIR